MRAKITNLASRVVFVSLNSGSTLRLSPGTSSEELADVEIKSNPKIEKLQKLRLIGVEEVTDQPRSSKLKEAKTESETPAKEKSAKSEKKGG